MKRIAIYILIVFISTLTSGCVWEEAFNEDTVVEEGQPATLHLDFVSMAVDKETVMTKGGDNHDINDLYILIFSSSNGKPGTLKSKLYTTDLVKENADISNDKGTASSSTSTKITTPIHTTTGESFIFAFGNIAPEYAPAEYDVTALKAQLDALEIGVDCYEDLMGISVPLKNTDHTSLQRVTDTYLMAGGYQAAGNYTRANTPCIIDQSGTLSGGSVRMYRLDARIDFNILSDTSTGSKGKFVPTAWRLYNVPAKSRLMTTAYTTGEDFDGKSPIYTTDASLKENYWNSEDMTIDVQGTGYSFSFYMFENRKEPTSAGLELDAWEYRHRETMNPLVNTDGTASTEGNKHSFAYAPEYATYIELDGYFTGVSDYAFGSSEKDGNTHSISATCQYRIHLGDFGSNVSGHSFNDFNTLRNYHYTYTITVKGVDQIVVEVNTDSENLEDLQTPGINGVVSYVSSNSHRVDSHFETRSIRVRKSDLAEWDEDDFRYLAQTCYGNYEGAKGTGSPRDDIYWMEFALTHKQYNDGKWLSWHTGSETGVTSTSLPTSGRTESHPSYMSYHHATTLSSSVAEVKKMYVNEFLQSLWEWKNAPENSGDNVHWNVQEKVYTVFIKENYYSNDDISKFDRQKNTEGISDKYHWKDFSNQPDRIMYVGMNTIESAETESSITDNVSVIRQRSIQTIYNTDHTHTGLSSSWGIETVDEMFGKITKFDRHAVRDGYNNPLYGENRIPKDVSGAGEDFESDQQYILDYYYNKDNGYKAQYYFMFGGQRAYTQGTANPATYWSRYVDQSTHDAMDEDHYYSFLECLSRNRDVDGDGLIDPTEIRWYLPAVNQLGDIFIGERGLDPEATLAYGNVGWTGDIPYLTSTFDKAPDGQPLSQLKVLAIEGFAYSNDEVSTGPYNVRCVRNMGKFDDTNYSEGVFDESRPIGGSLEKLRYDFDEPQKYVQVDEANRIMDLTYLSDKAKRGYVAIELTAEHGEYSDENQLYKKFQWADGLVSASHTYTQNGTTYYNRFSADEVAYGERNNSSMRTLTRASLYPYDKPGVVQSASEMPLLGWRAPNQKELMLLHFHANGFSAGTSHTCTNADGGSGHESYSGDNWFFCRTCFTYGGVKANRDWREWGENWITDATYMMDGTNTYPIQNEGEWYRFDGTNTSPNPNVGWWNYRYAFNIMHNGTSFGLLMLDYYLLGNPNSKQSCLVPVRDYN